VHGRQYEIHPMEQVDPSDEPLPEVVLS
jgi:hypothetical protein